VSNNSKLRFLVVLLVAAFASAALALADVGALGQNSNSSTTEPGTSMAASGQNTPGESDLSGEKADLSGTYTGNLTMTGGHEMSGQVTLTITENTFQLSGEGMSHGGRVYAITTRGYTGAAFYFTDLTDPTTKTPVVANVRARKNGDRLTLTPVPGARTRMRFTTGAATSRRRGRRAPAADTNANTGDNTNTATPPR
jgi:hypothetical protein